MYFFKVCLPQGVVYEPVQYPYNFINGINCFNDRAKNAAIIQVKQNMSLFIVRLFHPVKRWQKTTGDFFPTF